MTETSRWSVIEGYFSESKCGLLDNEHLSKNPEEEFQESQSILMNIRICEHDPTLWYNMMYYTLCMSNISILTVRLEVQMIKLEQGSTRKRRTTRKLQRLYEVVQNSFVVQMIVNQHKILGSFDLSVILLPQDVLSARAPRQPLLRQRGIPGNPVEQKCNRGPRRAVQWPHTYALCVWVCVCVCVCSCVYSIDR